MNAQWCGEGEPEVINAGVGQGPEVVVPRELLLDVALGLEGLHMCMHKHVSRCKQGVDSRTDRIKIAKVQEITHCVGSQWY